MLSTLEKLTLQDTFQIFFFDKFFVSKDHETITNTLCIFKSEAAVIYAIAYASPFESGKYLNKYKKDNSATQYTASNHKIHYLCSMHMHDLFMIYLLSIYPISVFRSYVKVFWQTGNLAQQLTAQVVFADDPGLVISTHIRRLTSICILCSR